MKSFMRSRSLRAPSPTLTESAFARPRSSRGAVLLAAVIATIFTSAHAQFGVQIGAAEFERRATLSKELGATHMLVTEGLPLATWVMDPDDPYPMWFAHHAGILTIFPPNNLQPFVDAKYVANVTTVLAQRCTVLRNKGLKAVWNSNEPEVLPEPFFTAHPELRGPRIDQTNRSRKVYFAASVDEPETLQMYRESVQLLLKTCPELDTFNWVTTDAGSGFDWSAALYPGLNGNSSHRDRAMSECVAGFLINVQQAAKEAGHDIRINMNPIEARQWMLPTFGPDVVENTVRKLPRGLAVEGREGPDGRPFAGVARVGNAGREFYPVLGIVVPSMAAVRAAEGPRMIALGDSAAMDLNYRLLKFTLPLPMRTLSERITALRAFAAGEVGEAQADNLVEAWSAMNDVQRNLAVVEFGNVLLMGDLLNRWITRPMVPFPEELTDAEKKDYRPFLFQAKGEEQAGNLVDIQAMRMYEGWGAKMLFQRTMELTIPRARRAMSLIEGIRAASKDEAARRQWELTAKRLQAFIYLLQSADNMVAYQAQLDRVKYLHAPVEPNPVLGVQSSWDRSGLMDTARKEIDVMVNLNRLLAGTPQPILDLAPSAAEETVMRLGPNLTSQLKHKIDVMNAHWRDYDRLFTMPNP